MTSKYQQYTAGWFKTSAQPSDMAASVTRARALLASALAAPIYAAFTVVNEQLYDATSIATTCAVSSVLALCAIFVIRFTDHPSAAGHLFTLALANQVFGEMALNGGLQAPAAALSLLIVPAAVFSAGASSIKIWASVTVIGLFTITSLDFMGYLLPNQLSPDAQQFDRVFSLAAGIVVGALMIIQFERQASAAINKLITERASFKHRALHDSLTGMPNRSYFYEHAMNELDSSDVEKGKRTILYFDIDGFKQVNDQYGHAIGDELLKAFSKRLTQIMRSDDFAARLAGDEFAMITGTAENDASTEQLMQHIRAITHEPFELEGNSVSVGLSIGHVHAPIEGVNFDALLNIADERMYADKSERRKAKVRVKADNVVDILSARAEEPSDGIAVSQRYR